MYFEWDIEKARLNRKKHRCSFEQATRVFADCFSLTLFDEDHSEDEERWITMGDTGVPGVLVVVHTFRSQEDSEVVRIISVRKATRKEREQYLSRRG